jgi:hypothetical protein
MVSFDWRDCRGVQDRLVDHRVDLACEQDPLIRGAFRLFAIRCGFAPAVQKQFFQFRY